MRRAGFAFVLASLFALLAIASPAQAATLDDVAKRAEALSGYATVCTDVVGTRSGSGWFDWRESSPPVIELDVDEVCRPIVRKWNRGYPVDDSTRQWWLARAIFVIAHESRHGEQFAADPNQLVTGDCAGVWCEDDADNYAASTFKRWAYRLRVYGLARRVELARRIAPDVGYHPKVAGWAWLG